MIYVLDYGSQYTQLIAKKLRRLGFAAEVLSGQIKYSEISKFSGRSKARGIVLSGSPASVGSGVEPDPAFFESGIPVLGICFGYQLLAKLYGGEVRAQSHREYGASKLSKAPASKTDLLTRDLSEGTVMWMSHGDSVVKLPEGAELLLSSNSKPAAYSLPKKNIWALQFHPEVSHSKEGDKILVGFAKEVCGIEPDWKINELVVDLKKNLKERLQGVSEVVVGASGGVDSTVVAVLLSEFVKVRAVFVDHGFQRTYDLEDLSRVFASYKNIQVDVVDAKEIFWKDLNGVSDPETKRKIIGRLFIEVFESHVQKIGLKNKGEKMLLGQGTIYSDVIESAANLLAQSEKIKSHHNVGGLPDKHGFDLIEPLRNFFKDEVREIGALLGIDQEFLSRHPFPGPGLAIRCVGELRPERLSVLQKADKIFHDELVLRGLYHKTWQAGVVLLPVFTVGVMGDGRSYESVLAIRAVNSVDAMTAEASELPLADLKEIASRIVNEVSGINRVVYDLTSKPPGTIEWE